MPCDCLICHVPMWEFKNDFSMVVLSHGFVSCPQKLPCDSMKSLRIYMFPYFPILRSLSLSLEFPLWSNVLWCFQTCILSRRWRLTNIDERDWCWGQRSGEGSLSASPILSHSSICPFSLCPPDKRWVRLFLIRMDRWSQKSAVKGTVRLRQHRV